ncbi:hypothetical protein H4R34_001826 [Dimargaris verticillata]|uniref:Uncharacterized protein n=1 Tax=Dimargaris verticillata TaxID=2761393 RepID=A0A9W8BAL8_9FUNG|nr:hypothetical protein H4R34_001826 [Dimargaris verticillata]
MALMVAQQFDVYDMLKDANIVPVPNSQPGSIKPYLRKDIERAIFNGINRRQSKAVGNEITALPVVACKFPPSNRLAPSQARVRNVLKEIRIFFKYAVHTSNSVNFNNVNGFSNIEECPDEVFYIRRLSTAAVVGSK